MCDSVLSMFTVGRPAPVFVDGWWEVYTSQRAGVRGGESETHVGRVVMVAGLGRTFPGRGLRPSQPYSIAF